MSAFEVLFMHHNVSYKSLAAFRVSPILFLVSFPPFAALRSDLPKRSYRFVIFFFGHEVVAPA